jgi:hypothetical protein
LLARDLLISYCNETFLEDGAVKKILITIVTLFVMASPAYAVTLSIGDSYYVGSVTDGIPSNPELEALFINELADLAAGTGDTVCATRTQGQDETYEICNREGGISGTFEDAVVAGNVKVDTDDPGEINTAGFTWILAKYDAGNAGSLVWYLGGTVASVTLPTHWGQYGLSHYTLFNPGPGCCQQVPEPGTLGLLGIGLLGLGFARRRKTA